MDFRKITSIEDLLKEKTAIEELSSQLYNDGYSRSEKDKTRLNIGELLRKLSGYLARAKYEDDPYKRNSYIDKCHNLISAVEQQVFLSHNTNFTSPPLKSEVFDSPESISDSIIDTPNEEDFEKDEL